MWEPSPEPYSVEVLNPTKQSKYKGIKSFIAYEITTTVSDQYMYSVYNEYLVNVPLYEEEDTCSIKDLFV